MVELDRREWFSVTFVSFCKSPKGSVRWYDSILSVPSCKFLFMLSPTNSKPWPMKWVVLAIVLGLAGYTYLTLRYRKPGPAYRPYQDTVNRVTVGRLLSSGYQRIALAVDRPADPQRKSVILGGFASATTARSGLPPELDRALVEKPLLA